MLQKTFYKSFNIKNVHIEVVTEKNPELYQYFTKHKKQYFINDHVFINEHKQYFNKSKFFNNIPKYTFIILPIYNTPDQPVA